MREELQTREQSDMAREQLNAESCIRCSAGIAKDQKLCEHCGLPTQYMSFKERNAYEVEQFKAWQERVAASA